MAQAARLPDEKIVLVVTQFEAEALLAAATYGATEAKEDMHGRSESAMERVLDSLRTVLIPKRRGVFDI